MQLDPNNEVYVEWVASLLADEDQLGLPAPNLAYAYSAVGYTYYVQGKLAEALAEYRRAMELAPDQKIYADWVANLLHQHRGQLKIPDSDLAYAYSALGYWYYGQGKFPEALAEYRRAMELAPDQKTYADWVKTLEKK